jgi:MYXO-CTERM domain-containing protein
VTAQPDGGNDVVQNPTGSVASSAAFEYHFTDDATRPVLRASQPGVYKVTLSADLANADPLFPTVGHAESEVQITVDGSSSGGGCSVAQTGRNGGFAMLGLLGLALFVRRRRAK